jgi:hypothetical protein
LVLSVLVNRLEFRRGKYGSNFKMRRERGKMVEPPAAATAAKIPLSYFPPQFG